jgi:hypothetical protein
MRKYNNNKNNQLININKWGWVVIIFIILLS